MFWPFWLMIASTATAVLPVWRSPMISSRWPRPIGIIESIALMPVCIGSCTDLRAMMPGAFTSILRVSAALIGPLPSIGRPSALTTRPISASPTGTCAILPVRLTWSPSLTSSKLPRSAVPTLSSSRFSTRPTTPPWPKSSSSPAIAASRPYTRAMPSPASSTVPVSVTATFLSKPSISLRMIWLISSARICMGFLPFCSLSLVEEPRAQVFELGADAAVQHQITDARDDASDQVAVDTGRDDHLLAGALLERAAHAIQRGGRQLLGGRHLGADAADVGVGQIAVGARDRRQEHDAPPFQQQQYEALHLGRRRDLGQDVLQDGALLLRPEHGVLQRLPQLVRLAPKAGQPVQLFAQLLELAGVQADPEQRARVTPRDRSPHDRHR